MNPRLSFPLPLATGCTNPEMCELKEGQRDLASALLELQQQITLVREELAEVRAQAVATGQTASRVEEDVEIVAIAQQNTALNVEELGRNLSQSQADFFTNTIFGVARLRQGIYTLNARLQQYFAEVEEGQMEIQNNITTLRDDLVRELRLTQTACLEGGDSGPQIPPPQHECGGPGWKRVAHLNSTQGCPTPLRPYSENGTTLCRRQESEGGSCDSVTFDTQGMQYSRVCGKVVGYQFGETVAFLNFNEENPNVTIEENYVSGIAVTHGGPRNRQHVWTFAAATAEVGRGPWVCPCGTTRHNQNLQTVQVPPFVGEDYFCEAGTTLYQGEKLYADDPLWDGRGCSRHSTCCTHNSPPWFNVDLPSATTDDIEVRLCAHAGTAYEDTLIETVELYVQ